jgi:hypothetical protein
MGKEEMELKMANDKCQEHRLYRIKMENGFAWVFSHMLNKRKCSCIALK